MSLRIYTLFAKKRKIVSKVDLNPHNISYCPNWPLKNESTVSLGENTHICTEDLSQEVMVVLPKFNAIKHSIPCPLIFEKKFAKIFESGSKMVFTSKNFGSSIHLAGQYRPARRAKSPGHVMFSILHGGSIEKKWRLGPDLSHNIFGNFTYCIFSRKKYGFGFGSIEYLIFLLYL